MSNVTRVQYNGLTLEPGTAYTIKQLQGLTGLPTRISRQDKTGVHGGNVYNSLYGPRNIAIEGRILCDSITDYFAAEGDLVRAFCIDEDNEAQPLTIRLWDGSEKTIDVFVIGTPQIIYKGGSVTTSIFRVELLAEDPFFRDTAASTYTAGLPVVGGTPVPTPVPSPLGTVSGGIMIINNVGDVATLPKFTIRGACVNPRITNATTGDYVELTLTLLAGEEIVIEMLSGGISVTKGTTDMYQYVDGDLFELIKNSNTLRFSANTYNSSALLTAEVYFKYLTIA